MSFENGLLWGRAGAAFIALACVLPVQCTTFQQLVEAADVIVMGAVEDGRRVAGVNAGAEIGIVVERVLKGQAITPGFHVQLNLGTPVRSGIRGYRGLWFLRAARSGAWIPIRTSGRGTGTIQDYSYPAIPDGQMAPEFRCAEDAPILEQVVCETGAGLLAGLGSERRWILYEALYMLPEDVGRSLLQRTMLSSREDVRLSAALALAQLGDLTALRELLAQYQTISDAQLRNMSMNALADGFRNSSEEAVQFLGELAAETGAQPLEVRRAAAKALRAIHTKETLPHLAQLLDSKDAELRYLGMSGLSCFAYALPVQTRHNRSTMGYLLPQVGAEDNRFKPEELAAIPLVSDYAAAAPYLDEPPTLALWRGWWNRHRTELGH